LDRDVLELFREEYSARSNLGSACGRVVDLAEAQVKDLLAPLGGEFHGYRKRDNEAAK
jgi:hypothetical protein